MHLTLFIKILTLDALKEDQVITEEETIELLESNRHALIGWELAKEGFQTVAR